MESKDIHGNSVNMAENTLQELQEAFFKVFATIKYPVS